MQKTNCQNKCFNPLNNLNCRSTLSDKPDILNNINTNIINSHKIVSDRAELANIYFFYDPDTNNSYIHNISNNLIFKSSGHHDSIIVMPNGNIKFNKDIEIDGVLSASNGMFSNDVTANNISLIGDVIATNGQLTNNLIVNKNITSNSLQVLSDMTVKGSIQTSALKAVDEIVTPQIVSESDLDIFTEGYSVNIPNIKYAIDLTGYTLVGQEAIKRSKIFVVTSSVILEKNESLDGMEIIVYNKNTTGKISIRDVTNTIYDLSPEEGKQLVYIYSVNKWIVL